MTVFRASIAALLGAIFAIAFYLTWFFGITHHDPTQQLASVGFIIATAVVAALCGLVFGYLAALAAPATPRGVADAVAALLVAAALFFDRKTPGQNHWAWLVFLAVAAPAAYAAGRLRKPVPATHSS